MSVSIMTKNFFYLVFFCHPQLGAFSEDFFFCAEDVCRCDGITFAGREKKSRNQSKFKAEGSRCLGTGGFDRKTEKDGMGRSPEMMGGLSYLALCRFVVVDCTTGVVFCCWPCGFTVNFLDEGGRDKNTDGEGSGNDRSGCYFFMIPSFRSRRRFCHDLYRNDYFYTLSSKAMIVISQKKCN